MMWVKAMLASMVNLCLRLPNWYISELKIIDLVLFYLLFIFFYFLLFFIVDWGQRRQNVTWSHKSHTHVT